MTDALSNHTGSTATPPPTFTNDDNKWKKQILFTNGTLLRTTGIPAAHAKHVPDDAIKHIIWTQKQGLHAISLFKHTDTDTYYVHVANGSRDYISNTFTDITNAKKHVSNLKQKDSI